MGALSEITNKVLLPVHEGNSLLGLQVDALRAIGECDITVVVGYREKEVRRAFPGCRHIRNRYYQRYNNSYSLFLSRNRLAMGGFLLNGDVACPEWPRVLTGMATKGCSTLLVRRKQCDEEDMKVVIEGGRITRVGKDIPSEEASAESVGAIFFSVKDGAVLARVLPGLKRYLGDWQRWYNLAVHYMVAEMGVRIEPYDITGTPSWEVDTPEDLMQLIAGYADCKEAHE